MKSDNQNWASLFLKVGVIVVCVWAGMALAIRFVLFPGDSGIYGVRGQFGDMFGAVNALFSGLAFAGLIIAIYLQNSELRLQRKELEETREVLREQKEQLEAQSDALSKQVFESTLFQMLGALNKIVDSISIRNEYIAVITKESEELIGRRAFKLLYEYFKGWFQGQRSQNPGTPDLELIKKTYNIFYKESQEHWGHYIRALYYIVKFIDTASISDSEKKEYAKLVRAQLSSYEVALIFYSCLHPIATKFKTLIEKYVLLNNLPDNLLFDLSNHLPLYAESAYGKRKNVT